MRALYGQALATFAPTGIDRAATVLRSHARSKA
jgi:hypothetical protein